MREPTFPSAIYLRARLRLMTAPSFAFVKTSKQRVLGGVGRINHAVRFAARDGDGTDQGEWILVGDQHGRFRAFLGRDGQWAPAGEQPLAQHGHSLLYAHDYSARWRFCRDMTFEPDEEVGGEICAICTSSLESGDTIWAAVSRSNGRFRRIEQFGGWGSFRLDIAALEDPKGPPADAAIRQAVAHLLEAGR